MGEYGVEERLYEAWEIRNERAKMEAFKGKIWFLLKASLIEANDPNIDEAQLSENERILLGKLKTILHFLRELDIAPKDGF